MEANVLEGYVINIEECLFTAIVCGHCVGGGVSSEGREEEEMR